MVGESLHGEASLVLLSRSCPVGDYLGSATVAAWRQSLV